MKNPATPIQTDTGTTITGTTITDTTMRTHVDDHVSARLVRVVRRSPLHFVIVLICLLWSVPTAGLLVSSFRPADRVATTGWWTAFATPFSFTLDNYQQVLTAKNLGFSFMNSLYISVPATIMPIVIAAFAAY